MTQLLYGTHLILGKNESIAICCLWSDKTIVESVLNPADYALLGNLYSNQGINILIRNLLLETKIRFLILTGDDRNKTGFAVKQLFEKGLDEKNCIRGTQVFLDSSISSDDIAFLTLRVKLLNAIGNQGSLKNILKELKTVEIENRFLDQREVPLPILKTVPYISNDEKGFFVIRIEDCRLVCQGKTCFSCIKPLLGVKEIVLEHYLLNGERTEFFIRGNQFEKVFQELIQSNLLISEKHKLYLMSELEKAFEALENNFVYVQHFADLSGC